MTQKQIFIILIVLLAVNQIFPQEVQLRFTHEKGKILHAESLVDETVYIDGLFSHQAEIDEFSLSKVISVDSQGSGILDSSFRTVERVDALPGILEWVSSETVRIERSPYGELEISDEASRPVLRGVPRFPDHTVKIGDSWSLPAEEVHVFRIGGEYYGPYRGDVQVRYDYLNNQLIDDIPHARIRIQYNIYLPVRSPGEPIRLISGNSTQELLWNIEEGYPLSRMENFEFLMLMANGRTQEFIGQGKSRYRISDSLDRKAELHKLKSELGPVPGLTIEARDNGILLSLDETDKILFEAESSEIDPDQIQLLNHLSEILKEYPDRDILISGHTAHYGSFEGRKNLSRARAAAVADILYPQGRPGPGRLFLRAAGSTEALGSDEENRRVEILILD